MVGHFHELFLALGVVVDHELQRVEHRHAARRDLVQVLAHAVFEDREVDDLVRLGHADALGEDAEALGRVAAAARAGERGHARVVPAVDGLLIDELDQPPLAQDHVGEVEAREFDLLGQAAAGAAAGVRHALVEPVVERAVVLELERAQRVVMPSMQSDRPCAQS